MTISRLGHRPLAETAGFTPVVSDIVSTEFASEIARLTRMNSLHLDGAREIFAEFDPWAASCADLVEVAGIDVQTAEGSSAGWTLTSAPRTP